MSIMEFISKMAEGAVTQAKKAEVDAYKNAGKQIKEYERKIQKAEKNINRMSPEQKEKIEEARKKIENRKSIMKGRGMNVSQSGQVLFGDKTVDQWNSKWESIGYLNTANLTPYNNCVGLYRHKIGNSVMYVGRAVELNNGGFRKRLSDYRRESNSARKHLSGSIIYDNLDRITTDILIVGDTDEAIKVTKSLEGQFIAKFNSSWNKQKNI